MNAKAWSEMTNPEKAIQILELAHAYAEAGSIIPFRASCIEHNAQDTVAAEIARIAIGWEIQRRGIRGKPDRHAMPDIIANAIGIVRAETDVVEACAQDAWVIP